jgi:hypothetical protein
LTAPISATTIYRHWGPLAPQTGWEIPIELVELSLVGVSPSLQGITVTERMDLMSLGLVDDVLAGSNGDFTSGDSFFDVFVEIDVISPTLKLTTNELPVRLDAGNIHVFPFLKTLFSMPQGPQPHSLPLYSQGGHSPAGWLCQMDLQLITLLPNARYLPLVGR